MTKNQKARQKLRHRIDGVHKALNTDQIKSDNYVSYLFALRDQLGKQLRELESRCGLIRTNNYHPGFS